MSVDLAAGIAGMVGLVVGAAAVLAWRPRNRRPAPRAEREEPTRLPPGVASVLSVLLYAQGLLGFAALATVLLKQHAHAEITTRADMHSGPRSSLYVEP